VARYGKEHKQATRQRIVETAARRLKRDGIDGSGVATLMSDAGLTNGAFYREPGPDYYTRHDPTKTKAHAVKQLEAGLAFKQPRMDRIRQIEEMYLLKEKPALWANTTFPLTG